MQLTKKHYLLFICITTYPNTPRDEDKMSDFKDALDKALAEVRARETAPLAPHQYGTTMAALRQQSKDKLDALTLIQQWLMQGASNKPVLNAPSFAWAYRNFWQYTLAYSHGTWWINRAIPHVISSRDYNLQEITALKYLDHISLQAIARGVARLVYEQVYNPPNFD
jgi:hypothetical protein